MTHFLHRFDTKCQIKFLIMSKKNFIIHRDECRPHNLIYWATCGPQVVFETLALGYHYTNYEQP